MVPMVFSFISVSLCLRESHLLGQRQLSSFIERQVSPTRRSRVRWTAWLFSEFLSHKGTKARRNTKGHQRKFPPAFHVPSPFGFGELCVLLWLMSAIHRARQSALYAISPRPSVLGPRSSVIPCPPSGIRQRRNPGLSARPLRLPLGGCARGIADIPVGRTWVPEAELTGQGRAWTSDRNSIVGATAKPCHCESGWAPVINPEPAPRRAPRVWSPSPARTLLCVAFVMMNCRMTAQDTVCYQPVARFAPSPPSTHNQKKEGPVTRPF
jgi:hypothetical protein